MYTAPARFSLAALGMGYVLAAALTCTFVGAAHAEEPLMQDLMGVNGHTVLFRPELYAPAVQQVRDYHNLSWDIGDDTSNDTSFPFAANGVNWTSVYGSWAAQGFTTDVSIQFSNISEEDWTDVAADAYKYGYDFARFFGSTHGNGLVQSMEIGNEPGFYSDSFYRTLFYNMASGIRAADPAMKIATCNVAVGPSGNYSKSLSLFEDMTDLVDVFSVHAYAHLTGWPTWEPSHPEDPNLPNYLTKIQDVIDWRDQNAPDAPVWVTEFGWDTTTQPNFTDGTFKDWMHVNDTEQAQYLTRSFLAFAEMDVERSHIYFFNDSDTPSLHASSGITRNFEPKPSYWAICHMQETLGDYRFSEVISQTEDELYIYAFEKDGDEDDQIWVLWSPTGEGREVEITLDMLGATALWAELMPLVEGDAPVVPFELLGDGSIRLNIGESPTYLAVAVPEPAALCILAIGAVTLLGRRGGLARCVRR